MKVENEYLKVRVGGGYLTIDEFVDQYFRIEMEKIGGFSAVDRFLDESSDNEVVVRRPSLISSLK